MASKRFDAITTQGLQRVRVGGSFQPNGVGTPTDILGNGWTITRGGVGLYTIAFNDKFFAMDEFEATALLGDGRSATCSFTPYDANTNTIGLRVYGSQASTVDRVISLDLSEARKLTANQITDNAGLGGILTLDSSLASLHLLNAGVDYSAYIQFLNNTVSALAWFKSVPIDAASTSQLDISLTAMMDGAVNTPNLTAYLFNGIGATPDVETLGPITNTLQTISGTFGAFPVNAPFMTVLLIDDTAAHAVDSIRVYDYSLTYTADVGSALVPIDLSTGSGHRISFQCIMRNTGVDY